MPDHLHVFVGLDDQKIELAEWMKSLKNTLSKALRFGRIAAPLGKKISLIMSCEVRSHTKRNGTMCVKIRCEPGLVKRWQDWPFGGEVFDLAYHSK